MVRVERDLILTVLRLMVRLISMRWVEMSLPLQIFHKHLLFQIKICYSKNFTRVNCDGIKSTKGGDMMGKCLR